jgi:hypothetical protein
MAEETAEYQQPQPARPPAVPARHKIYVGVDLGTTFTGQNTLTSFPVLRYIPNSINHLRC